MYSDGKNIIWKRMIYHGKDLGDYYLVSNTGEIKGVKTGKIRKKNINHEGYYYVSVSLGSRDNKPCIKIHRAVAELFIPNPENKPFVDHINTITTDNRVENLRWVTAKENVNNPLTKQHMKGNNGKHMLGRSLTEETKIKIGNGNKGKVVSEETKLKMSIARKAYLQKRRESKLNSL